MTGRIGTGRGTGGDEEEMAALNSDAQHAKMLSVATEELLGSAGGDSRMIHISTEEGMKLRTLLATRVIIYTHAMEMK